MKLKQTQTGVITVLAAISMLVVVAIAGAGIDMGHSFLNKTRAQNLVDALALAGAKSLDESEGDKDRANEAIQELFNLNMLLGANKELQDRLTFENITVQYSELLTPFTPGAENPQYVRVATSNISLESWFIRLLGIDRRDVGASAVAGPSVTLTHEICDFAPMMACGDPTDTDHEDGSFWGYEIGQVQMLKAGSGNESERCIGPGNFQLIDLGDGHGGATVRELMAGGDSACEDVSDGIDTKPGNTVGPALQGLNVRFNIYTGPIQPGDYPPDVLTDPDVHQAPLEELEVDEEACVGGAAGELLYSHEDYIADVADEIYDNPPPPDGVGEIDRRVLRIPIGNCSDESFNGASTVPYLGTGCFFLLRQIDTGGHDSVVFGEFIENCTQDGALGPDPNDGPGSYRIILYKDTASIDS